MATRPVKKTKDPDVILDVLFEDGMLIFSVRNKTDRPVYTVRCNFAKPVIGLDGVTDLARANLFSKLEFLAPGRDIRMPIDRIGPYFARGGANLVICTVSYTDADDADFVCQIRHDLSVYRDLQVVQAPVRD